MFKRILRIAGAVRHELWLYGIIVIMVIVCFISYVIETFGYPVLFAFFVMAYRLAVKWLINPDNNLQTLSINRLVVLAFKVDITRVPPFNAEAVIKHLTAETNDDSAVPESSPESEKELEIQLHRIEQLEHELCNEEREQDEALNLLVSLESKMESTQNTTRR